MENCIIGKNILIAEDEADLLMLFEDALTIKDAKVFRAKNGKEAIDLFNKVKMDLIVSDIRMPNGDGVFLLEEIRKNNPMVPPILLITGYADLVPEKAYKMGADGFLFKPFSIQKILTTINSILQPLEKKWLNSEPCKNYNLLLKRDFESLEDMLQSQIINFGRGGFFVSLASDLPAVDEYIEFDFKFKNGNPNLSGIAICRWVRENTMDKNQPRGAGFEFCYINPENRHSHLVTIHNKVKEHSYIPNSIGT